MELTRHPLGNVRPLEVLAVMATGALIGAKLYSVMASPGRSFAAALISPSGFTFYGALIVDCIGVLILARCYRVPALKMSDALAAPCALAYGIARIGCPLSGDGDYGSPTTMPWGMSFPHGIEPTIERVHPAPVYEVFTSVLVAHLLWRRGSLHRHRTPIGEVSALFLLLTGTARFCVEFVKRNPRIFFGLNDAQIISLSSVVASILILYLTKESHRQGA